MKSVLIVYIVSWFILLAVYVSLLFIKKKDSSEKQPWYLYILMALFAPLVVPVILYILLSTYWDERKNKYQEKTREKKETEEKAYKESAMKDYFTALALPHENHSFFWGMTAQTLVEKIKEKDYSGFMEYLHHLSLPAGVSLKIEECRQNGEADVSKLFVETADGKNDYNIWQYIKVDDSIDGAWDAYFLYKVWHILPLWWHAHYSRRIFLYSDGDVNDITRLNVEENEANSIRTTLKSLVTDPDVVKINGNYYISCCFWSDFGGLIKEIVELKLSALGKASFLDISNKTLYEYDCGIRY